jgi:hypothetical protein
MISIVSLFQAWRKQADNEDSKTFMYYVKDLTNLGITVDFNLRDEAYQVECFRMFDESEMNEFLEWYGSKEIVAVSGLAHYNLLLDNDLLNLRQARSVVANENLLRVNKFPIKPKFWKFICMEENKIRIIDLKKTVSQLEKEKSELESKLDDIKLDNELVDKAKELIKANKELLKENTEFRERILSLKEELEEMNNWNTEWRDETSQGRDENVKLKSEMTELKHKYNELVAKLTEVSK